MAHDDSNDSAQQAADEAAAAAPAPTAAEKRAAAAQSARQASRYSRERLLSQDGERITGQPHAVIAGALHDDDAADFTAADINRKIEAFLGHEDTTGQEA